MTKKCNDCNFDSLLVKEVIRAYCNNDEADKYHYTNPVGPGKPIEPEKPVEPPVEPEEIPYAPMVGDGHLRLEVRPQTLDPMDSFNITLYEVTEKWYLYNEDSLIASHLKSEVPYVELIEDGRNTLKIQFSNVNRTLRLGFITETKGFVSIESTTAEREPIGSVDILEFPYNYLSKCYLEDFTLTLPEVLPNSWVSLNELLYGCKFISTDISIWDVSNIQSMNRLLYDARFPDIPELNLSLWCVQNIPNRPEGFTNGSLYLQEPVWGTCPSSIPEPVDVIEVKTEIGWLSNPAYIYTTYKIDDGPWVTDDNTNPLQFTNNRFIRNPNGSTGTDMFGVAFLLAPNQIPHIGYDSYHSLCGIQDDGYITKFSGKRWSVRDTALSVSDLFFNGEQSMLKTEHTIRFKATEGVAPEDDFFYYILKDNAYTEEIVLVSTATLFPIAL